MGKRIPFNYEEEREHRNWREIEPGDMVWHVPDPDENGTIDPEQIKLFWVVKSDDPHPLKPGVVNVVNGPMFDVSLNNLMLAMNKPGEKVEHTERTIYLEPGTDIDAALAKEDNG